MIFTHMYNTIYATQNETIILKEENKTKQIKTKQTVHTIYKYLQTDEETKIINLC